MTKKIPECTVSIGTDIEQAVMFELINLLPPKKEIPKKNKKRAKNGQISNSLR